MAEILLTSDPKATSPQEHRELFYHYLLYYEFSKIMIFLQRITHITTSSEPINRQADNHYSYTIALQKLIEYDSALTYYLLNYPLLLIPVLQETLIDLLGDMIQHPSYLRSISSKDVPSSSGAVSSSPPKKLKIPKNIHIRFSHLPPVSEFIKSSIGTIRSKECNTLIQLSATIIRTGAVRMLELSKKYQCHNHRCQHSFRVYADPEQDYLLPQPKYCPNMIRNTSNNGIGELKKCNSSTLQEMEEERQCVDYQEIKIQDRMEQLPFGTTPRSIIVILEADLVDKFNPGDDVIVIGTLIRRWRNPYPGARCGIDLMIQANNIYQPQEQHQNYNSSSQSNLTLPFSPELHSSYKQFDQFWSAYRSNVPVVHERNQKDTIQGRELYGRNAILQSICPQLYGLFLVKLALLMALIGGSSTSYETGVRRRSQIHLLMVGDPGCGKSQLLRFASKLISRSVYTTGIGTTGAGLTCSAVKEGNSNEWALEAGALVLANGGICCIDEFSSIREQDRTTIHEAMEQQTISIAKAGLVAKLPTRTTIIACCNPKGQYDLSADITVNTAIAGPLLSRFDIVLILIDQPNKDWDKAVSTHLLKRSIELGQKSSILHMKGPSTSFKSPNSSSSTFTNQNDRNASIWDEQTLRDYINCVKRMKPIMTEAAQQLIIRFYQMQRQNEERSTSRTTVRLLESLVRVSEAHARIMFHPSIEIMDAVMAILCVSISGSITSVLDNAMDIIKEDFELENPNEQYERHERRVFQMLQYSKERLWKDLAKKKTNHESHNHHPINSNNNNNHNNDVNNNHHYGSETKTSSSQHHITKQERSEEYSSLDMLIEKERQQFPVESSMEIKQEKEKENEQPAVPAVSQLKEEEISSNSAPSIQSRFLFQEEIIEEEAIHLGEKRGLEDEYTAASASASASSAQKRVKLSSSSSLPITPAPFSSSAGKIESDRSIGFQRGFPSKPSSEKSQSPLLRGILKTTSQTSQTSSIYRSSQLSKAEDTISNSSSSSQPLLQILEDQNMTQTFYSLDALNGINERELPIKTEQTVIKMTQNLDYSSRITTADVRSTTQSALFKAKEPSPSLLKHEQQQTTKKNIFLRSSNILNSLNDEEFGLW